MAIVGEFPDAQKGLATAQNNFTPNGVRPMFTRAILATAIQ
jgi:hypothetical protein